MSQSKDCLKCTAHNSTRWSYSQWVLKCFSLLQAIRYKGVVIYDWHDVPTNTHMHWDVTIFLGGLAHRIEIDGPRHNIGDGHRLAEDEEKDSIVCQNASRSLLRLSYDDVDAWRLLLEHYMTGRMHSIYPGVWCSSWNQDFQGVGFGMVKILQVHGGG